MKVLIILVVLLVSCATKTPKAKEKLISWQSSEGITRLERSKHKVDFFKLANNFIGQNDGVLCGPTTGALVLNTLRIRNPKYQLPKTSVKKKYIKHIPKKWNWDPRLEKYTPASFVDTPLNKVKSFHQIYGKPTMGKRDIGLQLRQLNNVFLAHKVKATLRVVSNEMSLKKIKRELIKNLSNENDYVVINYARKSLGQKGGGHISPLAAYDEESDSFLIMDVNPNKDNWVWIDSKDLVDSMRTFDTIENRGYLLLRN